MIVKLLRITGHKVKLSEGLNQIYALRAASVKELLDPVGNFPESLRPYFRAYLNRYPYQMDPNILTSLYTLSMQVKSKLYDSQ